MNGEALGYLIAGFLLLAYLVGSIPFGLLLTKYAGMGDIRTIGSGNIGATNVMRTGNKKLGVATLLLDAGKGFLAVWLVGAGWSWIWYNLLYCAALAAVLGHIFPIWLKFKGGKGVATAIGAIFALHWMPGLMLCGVWLLVFALTRYASLASIIALWAMPLGALYHDRSPVFYVLLALLITWTHRENIKRLINGTERSFRKDKAS